MRVVATGLRFPEGPVVLADGSIALVEIARGTVSRVTQDGIVSIIADLGGGPNGLALGPDGNLFVCNNGGFKWTREADGTHRPIGQAEDYSGGRIERVDLNTGRSERLLAGLNSAGSSGVKSSTSDMFTCADVDTRPSRTSESRVGADLCCVKTKSLAS